MPSLEGFLFRRPRLEDGMAVFRLIERCPPLDVNSNYCNLLQCSHFAATSVAAEMDGDIAGFLSGYALPERPDILFIWQLAVAKQARGRGLASQMLTHILARPQCRAIRYLETTITRDNKASWAVFNGLAKRSSASLQAAPWMDKETHFSGQHESEELVRIGPFNFQADQEKGNLHENL